MSSFDFEAASESAFFGGLGDWYHQSSEEREAAHNERLALPSFSEEAEGARNRNSERRAKRAENKQRATKDQRRQA